MRPTDRTRREYARRINAALDFVNENLGQDITLARLAAEANFSPFHFHRIFTALIGEPPAEYIRRLRLEKAAGLLAADSSATVTAVALTCGFSTSALFCRLFKARFGASPTAWREKSKNRQAESKNRKDISRRPGFHWDEGSQSRARRPKMVKTPVVKVQEVPSFRVAFVKHMKGYDDSSGIGSAFETLFAWAGPRGVMSPEMRIMGVPLDNPDITPKDKCRYYACLAVDDRAQAEGDVGVMSIRAGRYAVGRFAGGRDVFRKAYAYMYGEWLPKSGYQPEDAPAFETYIGEPAGTPSNPRFVFDLYVPVRPLCPREDRP
jgi:AraC family transcriptional regulator